MSRWCRHVVLLGVMLLPAELEADPVPRCRCAERSLDQYFTEADLVLIGRVTSIRRVPGDAEAPERVEVQVRSLFRAGGTYKGDLQGLVLATPVDPASCGIPVENGGDYIIFAARGAGDNRVAWFDTCSGSRGYPGSPERGSELFLGLSAREAVLRLHELSDGGTPASPTGEFHTSPACWQEPRIHHQGSLPGGLTAQVAIRRVAGPLPDREGILSPNRGYVAWGATRLLGDTAVIVVDVERPTHLGLVVTGAAGPVTPRWVTEKLLFFRVMQGRVQFTDVLVDVELGRPVYIESARDGQIAFEQFRQGCLGQCPCLAVPGSADSLTAPPRQQGLALEEAALRRLTPGHRAYLDADWDGVVFSEAGGVRFTRSQLHGAAARPEYTIDLRDLRHVDGSWWIQVTLYAANPCDVPDAAPAHAGWVPAFSRSGHLVVGTWSEGC